MTSQGGASILKKFIILLVFMAFVFIADAVFILRSPDKIIRLDHVKDITNDLLVGVVKLEYMLDIYVVAGEFESGRAKIIKEDINDISKLVDIINSSENKEVVARPEVQLIVSSINSKWKDVVSQLGALDKARSSDEVLFIHNYADQTTYGLSEDLKKLKLLLEGEWGLALKFKRDQDIAAIVVSLILVIAAGVFFIIAYVMPVRDFLGFVGNAISGQKADFRLVDKIPGELGVVYRGLAGMYDKLLETESERESVMKMYHKEMSESLSRIVALKSIAAASAKTLSHHDAFMEGITRTMDITGAFAAAVYLREGGSFKLSVSKGFSSSFFYRGESMTISEAYANESLNPENSVRMLNMEEYVHGSLQDVLVEEGAKMLLLSPIVLDNAVVGVFIAVFNDRAELTERNKEFSSVVASIIASSYSHAILFNKEFITRSFYERIIDQMSFGIGVFSSDGLCVVGNSAFKKHILGYATAEFVGIYNVYEDDKFISQGATPMVKNAFSGIEGEFVLKNAVDGVPSVSVLPARVRVIVLPLFTSSGTVGHVMLKTEAVKERQ